MKKSTLAVILTALLPLSFASYADSSSDTHGISITVPEVRLLNIKNAPGGPGGTDNTNLIKFEERREAGSVVTKHYTASGFFDITANVKAGSNNTRSILVSAEGIDENWQLKISSASLLNATPKPVILTASNEQGELVTNVTNVAMKDIELKYLLEPLSAEMLPVPDFTESGISLTFTLTDET